MSGNYTVAVAICCMDQRLHEPEAQSYRQLQAVLGVDRVYVLTGAGPEGKLLRRGEGYSDFVADTQLIINAKGATKVAVCGHYDCAGHPVEDHQHDTDVMNAVELLREALEFDGEIIPLIAKQSGDEATASTWLIQRLS
jgi:carbonic anhydrase